MRLQVDQSERYGEAEAAGPATSRVEEQDALAAFDERLVGVAEDDQGDAGGGGVKVKLGDRVEHVDQVSGELDGFGRGQAGAGTGAVDVAANGGDRGDGAEGIKDGRVADITGVEDGVDAGDGGEDLGSEEAVGVGKDGEAHGSRGIEE